MSSSRRGRPTGTGKKPSGERLSILLSKEDKEKLQKYADREGITMTEAIERFIRELDLD